ncbi:MAG TPA: hydrolase [Lentisphaeria bacterium]|nr:MAG: hydrolase [Lentisphaerae bacterium GWF2_50_93]HCE42199.1 hydrolase [Lentisphaeria bacterium]
MSKNNQFKRRKLYKLLGDLPPRNRKISAKLISKEEQDGYVLEKLLLDLNGFEPVPAYFVKPLKSDGPLPCILYNHAHGGNYVLGKDELINGRDALQKPTYAKLLTSMGYSALCVDTWLFGERRGLSESELFKEMLWKGQVLWGMMVYDNIRAMDYIASRPDVDRKRIGTMGISMGSTMAWWTAALDIRVKVCVDLCCLTDFEALIESRGLDGHGIYYYVPSLLKHFSTAQINALIAPRPHLSLAGIYDRLTPPAGLDKIDRELKKAYGKIGAKDFWKLSRYDIGHYETAAMRAEIIEFLKKYI